MQAKGDVDADFGNNYADYADVPIAYKPQGLGAMTKSVQRRSHWNQRSHNQDLNKDQTWPSNRSDNLSHDVPESAARSQNELA